jgi:3'-5' exoribonuclease
MHHAFQGGLLEHTLQMTECADALLKLPFFEPLNRDLCLFGILFHDFGKIFEYHPDHGFKKTIQGVLVPHIPMMGALIFETCNKFGVPEIIRDHLVHVVLAHHMQLAWGSPVIPAVPEAAFVHYVDNLHGTVFGWLQKIEANKSSGSEILTKWDGVNSALLATPFTTILKTVEAYAAEADDKVFDEGDLPF